MPPPTAPSGSKSAARKAPTKPAKQTGATAAAAATIPVVKDDHDSRTGDTVGGASAAERGIGGSVIANGASMETMQRLAACRLATDALRAELETCAYRLYVLEGEALPLWAHLAALRPVAAALDAAQAGELPELIPRDFISSPLNAEDPLSVAVAATAQLPTRKGGSTASGASSGGGATSIGSSGACHVTSVEPVVSAGDVKTHCQVLGAEGGRWLSLSYGPSLGLVDARRNARLAAMRVGVPADFPTALAVHEAKHGPSVAGADAAASNPLLYHHPMAHHLGIAAAHAAFMQ